MVGVNSGDGRGNITAYATVFDSKSVLQRDRDYSACSLSTNAPIESFDCGGSATNHIGTFTNFRPASDPTAYSFTVHTPDRFDPRMR